MRRRRRWCCRNRRCRSCRRWSTPAASPARMLDVSFARIQSSSCCRCGGARTSPVSRFSISAPDRVRGAGVPRIARYRRIEFSLPAVQPGRVVADAASERGDRGWPADGLQQQVPGGVVADLQRRLTQFVQRHVAARPGLQSSASSPRSRPDRRTPSDRASVRPARTICSTRAAAYALNVEHIANDSASRWPTLRPGLEVDGVHADRWHCASLQRLDAVRRSRRAAPPGRPVRVRARLRPPRRASTRRAAPAAGTVESSAPG